MSAARGIAGFFGAFSLANAVATLAGSSVAGNAWWLDTSMLPVPLIAVLMAAAGAALLGWAALAPRLRWSAALAAGGLAAVALANSVAFYRALANGTFAPLVPVPVTAIVAVSLAWVATSSIRGCDAVGAPPLKVALAAAAVAVLFPLAQVALFGTTDYRRPADAAVVLGARAYANGGLSQTLEDRVRTAVDLYRAGLVDTLVMSGGVGESGTDETVAMRDRAVALGVPPSAIMRDPGGVNTDATVADTVPIFRERGWRRVLAVSQFYHLPRIKMAYRAAGVDVQTVPATGDRYIGATPVQALREVGGFWAYWAKGLFARIGA